MKRQKKNSEKFIKPFTQGAAELFSQLYILMKPHQKYCVAPQPACKELQDKGIFWLHENNNF